MNYEEATAIADAANATATATCIAYAAAKTAAEAIKAAEDAQSFAARTDVAWLTTAEVKADAATWAATVALKAAKAAASAAWVAWQAWVKITKENEQ